MANNLKLRIKSGPYGDTSKNKTLSLSELDDNFIHLKGLTIANGTLSGGTLNLNRLNGETIPLDLSQLDSASENISNANLVWTGDTIQNLNGNVLTFSGGTINLTEGIGKMIFNPNLDVSSLNPGITLNGGQITNRLYGHLIVDIISNDNRDAFAIRSNITSTGDTADTILSVLSADGYKTDYIKTIQVADTRIRNNHYSLYLDGDTIKSRYRNNSGALSNVYFDAKFKYGENVYYIDAVSGDNSTGVKNDFSRPFQTMAYAESLAASGDTLYVLTDVRESNLGKDGILYKYADGVKHSWYKTDSPGGGLNQNKSYIFNDLGKGTINFKVYGGIFEWSADWFGSDWDRALVRLDNGSNAEFYDVESLNHLGDDGWLGRITGGSVLHMTVHGDSYLYGAEGIIIGNDNTRVILNFLGNVTVRGRILNQGITGENTKMFLKVSGTLKYTGHPLWIVRHLVQAGYGVDGGAVNKIYIDAGEIIWYDEYETVGISGAMIFTYSGGAVNHHVTIKSNLISMAHDNRAAGVKGSQPLIAPTFIRSGGYFEVDLDVRKIKLDKLHKLCKTTGGPNRVSTFVKLNGNVDIISTDETLTGIFVETTDANLIFGDTTRIVLNPDSILSGSTAIGSTNVSFDDAMITGSIVSNGDVYSTGFTNTITGVDYATGIPSMYMLNSTINYDYFKNI